MQVLFENYQIVKSSGYKDNLFKQIAQKEVIIHTVR